MLSVRMRNMSVNLAEGTVWLKLPPYGSLQVSEMKGLLYVGDFPLIVLDHKKGQYYSHRDHIIDLLIEGTCHGLTVLVFSPNELGRLLEAKGFILFEGRHFRPIRDDCSQV